MATRNGYLAILPEIVVQNDHLSPDLTADVWMPSERISETMHGASARAALFPVESFVVPRAGWLVPLCFEDFYYRIHSAPNKLVLGNIGSEQIRQVNLWNAWLGSRTLISAEIIDGEGIVISVPGGLPRVIAPLEEVVLTLQITLGGASAFDAQLVLTFSDAATISIPITGARMLPWPVPPDWGSNVNESLEWLTDLQRALDGSRDTMPVRETPRRTWEFDLVEGRRERRIAENLLFDWTARIWALPVFVDLERLPSNLASGSVMVPINPTGLDYVSGGQMLFWTDVQTYELAEIATVEADHIVLARGTARAWPRGARVWPCRQARLVEAPQLARKTDRVITSRLQFRAHEACDWPAVAPPATYLGIPVLEHRGDEQEDPTASFPRQVTLLDGDVGLVDVDDVSGLAWPTQSHAWRLYGRAERAAHRSLLYWLAGRAQLLWLPTWADDLQLVEPTDIVANVLTVEWAGVGLFLHEQRGRRHLRIELNDGRIFYRRVTGADDVIGDSTRERVSLSAGLGEVITPGQVRLICWMGVHALASDRVEISHAADSLGLADCKLELQAEPAEEPL